MTDLTTLIEQISVPSGAAADAARTRQGILTKPTGALGCLEALSIWVCAAQGTCPPRAFIRPRVVIFAGDHGVARTSQTSAYPPEVTAQMVLNFVAGGAAVNVLARQAGASVRVVDVSVDADPIYAQALAPDVVANRIRRGSGSIDREDAMTEAETAAAFALGRRIADEEIDAGADLLIPGDMGIGNTTPAAAIIGLLANADAATVTGKGTGIDDSTWMRKCAAVRDAMRRGAPHKGDPLALLTVVGSPDFAAATGFLLQAAARGVPVILDGTISAACALVADRISYRAKQWWLAGHRSTEPAHALALNRLDLDPIIDYGMRLGEGTGALLALMIVQSSAATLREMATFGEAGVSDRDA
ncbi:MAG: nicotinate-nucleotide--dimethylbenzimidazole phosphoribosyltransferase [Candidatus Nanopelagicales bacterium]